MVAGYVKNDVAEKVLDLLGGGYYTTEFCYEGGFAGTLCYTGPEMDSYEAHSITCQDGVYEATTDSEVINLTEGEEVYEHILEEPVVVAGPHGDYEIVAELYGYNEEDDDRYEC